MLDKARSDYFYSFLPVCAAALVLAAQARACVFEIRMSARENCSVLSENARERTRSKFLRFFFGSILSVLLSFWKKNLLNSTVVKPRCVTFRHEEIWTSLDKIFEKEGCQADANKFWEKGKIFFCFSVSLFLSFLWRYTMCWRIFFSLHNYWILIQFNSYVFMFICSYILFLYISGKL